LVDCDSLNVNRDGLWMQNSRNTSQRTASAVFFRNQAINQWLFWHKLAYFSFWTNQISRSLGERVKTARHGVSCMQALLSLRAATQARLHRCHHSKCHTRPYELWNDFISIYTYRISYVCSSMNWSGSRSFLTTCITPGGQSSLQESDLHPSPPDPASHNDCTPRKDSKIDLIVMNHLDWFVYLKDTLIHRLFCSLLLCITNGKRWQQNANLVTQNPGNRN
jgi:hypothetical protein